jgi:YYY domain-containing protein
VGWFQLSALWYLQTLVITLALAPFVFWMFRGVPDRGASFAKPLALLLAIWPAWYLAGIGSGLVPYGPVTIWVSVIALGALAWVLAFRTRVVDREALGHLAIAEGGFVVLFLAYIIFHGYGPTIELQEKSMDLMMLSSSMRADSMPPNDSWLAGHGINYYYLGYLVLGTIGRMVGATPAEAFSLGLATTFAMTVVAVAGVAGNVIGRWSSLLWARIAGIVAVAFVVIAGNPWSVWTFLSGPSIEWNAWFFDGIAWNATRQLESGTPDSSAISEFPAFSFIFADLHPHLMALPFAVTAIGTAWMLATLPKESPWPRLIAAGGVFGSLYAFNSWDFPTYLVVGLLALLWGTIGWAMRDKAIAAATVVVSALVLWLPFFLRFEAPSKQTDASIVGGLSGIPVIGGVMASVAGYSGPRTSFGEYVGQFGFFWIVALVLIAVEYVRRNDLPHDPAAMKMLLGFGAVLIVIALIAPAPVLILAGLPIIGIVMLIERNRDLTATNVALGLLGFGFALTIIPEFFLLLDIFGNRMNTVFKVYYQAWLLLGLGAAIAIAALATRVKPMPAMRWSLAIGAAAIVALGGIYPIVVGNQWLNWRSPDREWVGLDGLHFLETFSPGEYAAIQYLWEHADDDDVILAAGGGDWADELGRPGGASGVPQILGWVGHERQWHLGDEAFEAEFRQRTEDISTLFETLDPALLDRYGVTYLYIGLPETRGARLFGTPVKTNETTAPGPFANAQHENWPGAGWTLVSDVNGVRLYQRDG